MANDTVCLKLWFNALGTSRKTDAGEIDVEADTEVLHISKRILQCPELKAIKQADAAFKRELERYCVQGLDIGVRIVKHIALEPVYELCEEFAPQRQRLVDRFIAAYPRSAKKTSRNCGFTLMPARRITYTILKTIPS